MPEICHRMGCQIVQLNPNSLVLSQTVLSLNTFTGSIEAAKYQVETQDFSVFGDTVSIVISDFDYNPYTKAGYAGLNGDVAESTSATSYFKACLLDSVVTAVQQRPKRW